MFCAESAKNIMQALTNSINAKICYKSDINYNKKDEP